MKPSPTRAVLLAVLVWFAAPSTAQEVPGYPGVLAEYISVDGSRTDGTPDALDRAVFLRLRDASLDEDDEVEAVLIAQPGFASTPGAWLQLGSQLVRRASRQACPVSGDSDRRCAIEVWIVDRRGSNLEDTLGLRWAWRANDPQRAFDYYLGSSALDGDGLVRQPADGNWDAMLGGPGTRFQPIPQDELPFMAEWGFEAAAGDLDALIDLLPRKARGSNVFVAGHSQGGGFVAAWAGRRGLSGRRGHENVAGLVFLDGGPSLGDDPEPDDRTWRQHVSEVTEIRDGRQPRYGAELSGITLGSGLAVRNAVLGVYYALRPDDESIFPPSVRPAHPAAECFVFGRFLPQPRCNGVGLRLTNRAHAGMAWDDDPVPGAFLQTPIITALGSRLGRLDFTPVDDTSGDCAAEGPDGLKPPCPPSNRQIDPKRVYPWLSGGADGPAGEGGVSNGWTSFDGGETFDDRFVQSGPDPSTVEAYILQTGFAPQLTNVRPITVRLGETERTIDAAVMNGMTWYQSRRYDLDLALVGGYQTLRFNRNNIRYDVDKRVIAAPLYVAARETRTNPFGVSADVTIIGPEGTSQSEAARARSPVLAEIDSSLYGHSDFLTADDSLAGEGLPGQPGVSLVAGTLADWMLARADGTTRVPASRRLGVSEW